MVISIYLVLFIFGLIFSAVLASLGFIGDFDSDSDVDLDVDTDVDLDFDTDVDLDVGGDIDGPDLDAGGGDVDAGGDIDAGDIDAGDIDADSDSINKVGGISPLSPFILSIFATTFGGFGIIFEEQVLNEYLVFLLAIVCGLAVTEICRYGFKFLFIKQQATTTVRTKDLVGEVGEVIVSIPMDGNVGTVQIITKAGRMTFSAKAKYEIASREIVKVTRQVGDVLYVEKESETLGDIVPKKNLPDDKSIKKIEVKDGPITIIYDQKQIEIKDSVVQKTNFGVNKEEEDE